MALRFLRLLDWHVLAALSLIFLVPWVIHLTDIDPRLTSALLGSVAFFGLMFRLISTYPDTNAATKVTLALLIATLALGAIGQYDLSGKDAPLSNVAFPIIGHRVGCIILACYWGRWLQTKRSPLLRHDT